MHGFDYSIPQFFTRVRGIRIVVTPDLISEVLHIPRVAHPNYPGCDRLRTVSKDELSSLFYEIPSSWGNLQNTPCSGFAKGPRFLNMVMTFILHLLSHYNSITEPHARFLLSFLEDISIDFCERLHPQPIFMMLGQTHVNGWSPIIAFQNGGLTSYIFPFRLRVLQQSRHIFNYWNK